MSSRDTGRAVTYNDPSLETEAIIKSRDKGRAVMYNDPSPKSANNDGSKGRYIVTRL